MPGPCWRRCRCKRLRHFDLSDVARFDALPFDAPGFEAQGRFPQARPYLHLRRHRRNLYPVALLVIGGWQGVFVTVLQWTAVLLGILYKTLARRSIPALSLTIYLVMGWTAIFSLPRLIQERFAASAVADPAGRGPLYGRSDRLCEEGIPLPPPGLASVYRPGAVVASGGDRLFIG